MRGSSQKGFGVRDEQGSELRDIRNIESGTSKFESCSSRLSRTSRATFRGSGGFSNILIEQDSAGSMAATGAARVSDDKMKAPDRIEDRCIR